MERETYKASYITRITCKHLESEAAFKREGEEEDVYVFLRAERFALIWREIKNIRRKINSGEIDRNSSAKALKFRKKALLALVQGANEFETERILAGDLSNFDGMRFVPTVNYQNN